MGMLRGFVVIVYIFAFFVAIWQASTVWWLIELAGAYVEATVVFSILVAFCGVLISIFVYIDGKEIDKLKEFTGLAKYEEEMLKEEEILEEVSCETCAFYKKPTLCPRRETNPKAPPCKWYKKVRR
jgi:hypothetical protein